MTTEYSPVYTRNRNRCRDRKIAEGKPMTEHIPENRTPILVVDDDAGLLMSIRATLVSAGMPEPALVSDSRRVIDLVRKHRFHLVLQDLLMPHLDGLDVLRRLKRKHSEVECIVVTAVDEVDTAVKAMQFGAYDYLVKPVDSDRLVIAIDRALERYSLRHHRTLAETGHSFNQLAQPSAFEGMIAADPAMAGVFRHAEICAVNNYNLLITGETGTGKDLLARIIHRLSPRSDGPFLPVNMAAFNDNLIESHLFGHDKGAFTGALSDKKGFFEAAQGGTLFLDEITELRPAVQGTLLRVIEEKELYRLGSTKATNVDVRILAASNRNLRQAVQSGEFRADLYYRLDTCRVEIPPLRERRSDILPLARHFLKKHARLNGKPLATIAPDLADRLVAYPFPGNVRELENMIASACILETGTELSLSSVRLPDTGKPVGARRNDPLSTLAEVEARHIIRVLGAVSGNKTRAAHILGIGLRTLQRRLKKMGR